MKRIGGWWALCLAVLVLLAACAGGSSAPTRTEPARAEPATSGPSAATSAPATAVPAVRREPELVKVGTIGANMSNAGIYIADERGYFSEEGIRVEQVPFDAGPRMVPALAINELQVGAASAGAALFNAIHRGIHSKVVADKGSNPPGAGWTAFVVRKDLYDTGAVRRFEDLRGRTFGLFVADASQEVLLDYYLRQAGLTLADVNVGLFPGPDQPAAFANRQLDAAWAIEPSVVRLVDAGLVVRLFGSEERHPNDQTSTLMYSEPFTRQRDLATRWMAAYLRGIRDYTDAFLANKGRDEVVTILEKAGVVTDRGQLERMGFTGLNPNGYVNRASLQEMHDYFLRKGTLTQPVPLDELVDDSFVTAALARLGLYDSPLYRDPVWTR